MLDVAGGGEVGFFAFYEIWNRAGRGCVAFI